MGSLGGFVSGGTMKAGDNFRKLVSIVRSGSNGGLPLPSKGAPFDGSGAGRGGGSFSGGSSRGGSFRGGSGKAGGAAGGYGEEDGAQEEFSIEETEDTLALLERMTQNVSQVASRLEALHGGIGKLNVRLIMVETPQVPEQAEEEHRGVNLDAF